MRLTSELTFVYLDSSLARFLLSERGLGQLDREPVRHLYDGYEADTHQEPQDAAQRGHEVKDSHARRAEELRRDRLAEKRYLGDVCKMPGFLTPLALVAATIMQPPLLIVCFLGTSSPPGQA